MIYDIDNQTDLITANVPIDKVTAHMHWFVLGCMNINRKFSFMTLPTKEKRVPTKRLNTFENCTGLY